MLSIQKTLFIFLNLYLSDALPSSESTIHLVAAAPSPMPMMGNAGSKGSREMGMDMGMGMGMGMEMGMGMGVARPSAGYYGGAVAAGSAQATGAVRGSAYGSGSTNSSSGGSTAAAQSLPNVETDIPSPVIASNPTYTLPGLLQSGTDSPQAVAVTGSTGLGLQPQPQPNSNDISQAETSGTDEAKSAAASSWSNPYFRKNRALYGTVISAWLILLL
ncbi:hypothetical protein GcM3_077023 [Golovinomyces cichoracearum]|uniref:Uncharacterized protein n=1 Tax=Golovinomyces cichoracearum TaxID=62708 RepID=A0A420IQ94_9PEZI|nr:hypothetical protein GcM3_077023 [Golovinomyces cichoracearum]